jgi:hypothetical protein
VSLYPQCLYFCHTGDKEIEKLEDWIGDHLSDCRKAWSYLEKDPGFILTTDKTVEHPSEIEITTKMEALRVTELCDWLHENFPNEACGTREDDAIPLAIKLLAEFKSRREGHKQC